MINTVTATPGYNETALALDVDGSQLYQTGYDIGYAEGMANVTGTDIFEMWCLAGGVNTYESVFNSDPNKLLADSTTMDILMNSSSAKTVMYSSKLILRQVVLNKESLIALVKIPQNVQEILDNSTALDIFCEGMDKTHYDYLNKAGLVKKWTGVASGSFTAIATKNKQNWFEEGIPLMFQVSCNGSTCGTGTSECYTSCSTAMYIASSNLAYESKNYYKVGNSSFTVSSKVYQSGYGTTTSKYVSDIYSTIKSNYIDLNRFFAASSTNVGGGGSSDHSSMKGAGNNYIYYISKN